MLTHLYLSSDSNYTVEIELTGLSPWTPEPRCNLQPAERSGQGHKWGTEVVELGPGQKQGHWKFVEWLKPKYYKTQRLTGIVGVPVAPVRTGK